MQHHDMSLLKSFIRAGTLLYLFYFYSPLLLLTFELCLFISCITGAQRAPIGLGSVYTLAKRHPCSEELTVLTDKADGG